MLNLKELTKEQLSEQQKTLTERYRALCAEGNHLLLTRGKPCTEQLDLSMGMLDVLTSSSDMQSSGGEDCRNYGNPDGLPLARKLFGDLLDAPEESIIIGNNSSLSIMFDVISCAVTHGFGGCQPWGKQQEVKFLCPVPGYDRHFSVTEYFGLTMIPIPMTATGPDMDQVEAYVEHDPTVKGIWCVPKYSNPQGITYSDETVRRFAALRPAAKDFRIFWDNAYCVHDLTDTPDQLLSLFDACKEQDSLELPIMFASSSKITFAGAGVSAVSAWGSTLADLRKHFSVKTIGPDKLNQLSHIRFLKDKAGVLALMKKHRAILQPKFRARVETLDTELAGTGAAEWTNPRGGYFVSVDVMEGCAGRVVALCKDAGVILNPPGSTYPYGKDPKDSNIRLAPSFPPVSEVQKAAEIFAVCTKLAAVEHLLQK